MIKASALDPDWYDVSSAAIVKQLHAVPAVRVRRNRWQIHRSHLPILADVREALIALTPSKPDPVARAARDAETEQRGFKLRWYQHDAVDFIRARRGALLADDLRVGKTLSALASHDPREGPLLVVCPLIARDVWRRWIEKMFPGEDVGILMGKTYDAEQTTKPITLVHYNILSSWPKPREFGLVIFDEAHVLCSRSGLPSQQSRAAALMASWAKRVVAATGTPIWNRPAGLFGILSLIAPYAFGTSRQFKERYCDPQPTSHGMRYDGVTHPEELNARLDTLRIRREWKDVQANLPPITREIVIADLTLAQHRAIDIATVDAMSGTAGALAKFRRALGAAKVKPTVEAARKVLDNGEPVVIWAWHPDTARKIAAALNRPDVWVIDGQVPQPKRELAFVAWGQSQGALILTIATGQVGIDLSHAKHTVFGEIDWTPAMIRQPEMRTYHPSRPMSVVYVVSDHLVERRMVMALHAKLQNTAPLGVNVGHEAIEILLTAFNADTQSPDMQRLMEDLLAYEFTS